MNRIDAFKEMMSKALNPEDAAQMALFLEKAGFFEAPASTKFHGAYPGGLFDHSHEVTKALVELTEKLSLAWQKPRSPYLVGMLHDLCKIDAYIVSDDGTIKHSNDMPLKGHGDKSCMLAEDLLIEMRLDPLTEEELFCIRWHMGAYDTKENWPKLNEAIRKYPNVLYTHTADMIASQINEM